MVMVFLDIEKAYDSLDRSKVWDTLQKKGVEKQTVARIKEMYQGSVSCVKIGGERSNWLRQRSGLKQGSALSPLLFICVMDEIMVEVAARTREKHMRAMVFADDVMMWGNTEAEVQERLNVWIEVVEQYSLKFNAQKCEMMVTTRNKERVTTDIRIGGEVLKKVESFKYLGSVIEESGRNDKEISERGRQAHGFLQSVRGLVWSRDVPQKSKQVLYRTYYVPILTYASETWVMKKRQVSRIQACEMKFQRSRLGITRRDRVRNETVREMVKEKPLQETIEKSRMCWYGHVKRMQDDRIPRRTHEMEMEGKRPRGRPRDRWIVGVKEEVQKRGEEWDRVKSERWWEDRKRWRGFCSKQTQPGAGNCRR